ncbi:MAG: helicase C-terminal domain-containing protein [Coriobacteriia bacterium]|nr:helicase C-terminal domain-containing protein [Coriobacteriia bacterium]
MPPALARFVAPGTDAEVAARYATLPAIAAEQSWGIEDEIAFLDVETTGFDPGRDRIIEVAVLVARGPEVVARYSSLVDPGRAIPRETTQLTGIDDAMLVGAPSMDAVMREVAAVVGARDIAAHHASFDRAFILEAANRAGVALPGRWLDSLELARIALPRLRSHRLRDLAEAFGLDIPSHRAEGDTEALFRVWRIALAGLADLPLEVLKGAAGFSPATAWTLRETLAHAAARGASRSLDLKLLRADATRGHHLPGLADAEERELVCPEPDEVLAEFGADGAVGRMYAGFEARAEQRMMAQAVLRSFSDRTHLAVEAGTGVGKSVAYLVPAATFALRNCLGVGVATKTNTLMDQLVHGELPRLAAELDGKLTYVALKGYEHYPCLRKLDRMLAADGSAVDEVANLAALVAWVAQSSWGDLDAVNLHWTGDSKRQVACSVEDCTHKRCRYFPNLCYLHGVRRRAGSAHIVVTNHALLFRDRAAAGAILPPLRYWIIDEAHAAESEARKQLSLSADHRTLFALLTALHAEGRGGAVDAVRARARTSAVKHGHEELAARVERIATGMRADVATASTIAGSFFDFLKDLGGEDDGYDSAELRVTDELRGRSQWTIAAGVGHSLARRLEAIVKSGRELLTALEEAGEEFVDARADLAGLLSRLRDQLDALEQVLDGADGSFVYSVRVSKRRDDRRDAVSAAMLDVGEALLERFYPEVHSIVYTSATIATGDDFGHFARTVGLDRLPPDAWDSLRLDSSYDFDRQMAVFIPSDIPEPQGARHLAALERLLLDVHTAMGGSVLTLFTSKREMEALYDRLAGPLEERGIRLLLQGRGVSNKRVRDEFLADERLSLFATKSFWEGFDAKGDTLRCVVIARLPFGRVRDPLYEERQQRYGRKAWNDFYLPEAVLELKQAAGRLVRSSTDEGCVIVADGRLTSGKGYARHFLEALPVRDIEVTSTEELVCRVSARFGRSALAAGEARVPGDTDAPDGAPF